MPRDADFKQHLCADIDGLSLHAAVRCGADDRQALEQLCRYITRPALADDRVLHNAAAQVRLTHERHWRDGNTDLVRLALEFRQLRSNGISAAVRSTGSTSAVGRYAEL